MSDDALDEFGFPLTSVQQLARTRGYRSNDGAPGVNFEKGDRGAMEETYAQKETQRRAVVFVDGKVHLETVDFDHAQHVASLLRNDGRKNVTIESRTANQSA